MKTKTHLDYNNCPNCHKKISFYAKKCRKCSWADRSKQSNPKTYKAGDFQCVDCNKKITYGAIRCIKCNAILNKTKRKGKNNPNYKNGISSEKKQRQEKFGKQNDIVEHHLYGKSYNETILLNRVLHQKIHSQAYWYILDKYGKEGINDYVSWFFMNYPEKPWEV